jgi:hypothetical protein
MKHIYLFLAFLLGAMLAAPSAQAGCVRCVNFGGYFVCPPVFGRGGTGCFFNNVEPGDEGISSCFTTGTCGSDLPPSPPIQPFSDDAEKSPQCEQGFMITGLVSNEQVENGKAQHPLIDLLLSALMPAAGYLQLSSSMEGAILLPDQQGEIRVIGSLDKLKGKSILATFTMVGRDVSAEIFFSLAPISRADTYDAQRYSISDFEVVDLPAPWRIEQ